MTIREEDKKWERVHPERRPDHMLPPGEAEAEAGKKKKSSWWLWLVVILGMALVCWWGYERFIVAPAAAKAAAAKREERAVPVVATASHTGDYPIYLEIDGTVQANNSVTVHSRVDGQLMKVLFKEGDLVQAGQLIAQIDPRPFEVQLEQANGQFARDQATLTNAEADLDRYQKASEAIPRQQIDTANAAVAQAKGALVTDQAAIDSAKLQIIYCNITAPISGKVGLRKVDEGNIIHASDVNGLVVIAQEQPISLVYSLAQDNLPAVQKAMKSEDGVEVDAYDKNIKTKIASGKLLAVDNQIDPATDTFAIKAQFDNTDNALYPNEFVNVRTLVETRRHVVLVPTPAVQTSPQSSFVFVVKPDNTVEMRPVVLGPQGEKVAVIDRGVSDGEMVVTDGLDKLQDGTKVTVRTPEEAEAASQSAGTQGAATQGHHGGGRKKQ